MLLAAIAYFAIVFAVGFACGPIRVLWLEPNFGATAAVLIEAPILIMAMFFAARFVPRKLKLANDIGSRLGMGLGALVLVLAADLCVGLFVRQQTLEQIAGQFSTPAGRIYAALLLLLALVPVMVGQRR
jgi:hypothetical protein